jgi:NADH/NAD ratio-sensing transcriptional regulator Rex
MSIPSATVGRLVTYLRILTELESAGVKSTSSDDLAAVAHVSAFQVRKDLAYFGRFGTRGAGYTVATLRRELRRILGLTRPWHVAIMGMGRLGQALADYPNYDRRSSCSRPPSTSTPHRRAALRPAHRRRRSDVAPVVTERGIDLAFLTVPGARPRRRRTRWWTPASAASSASRPPWSRPQTTSAGAGRPLGRPAAPDLLPARRTDHAEPDLGVAFDPVVPIVADRLAQFETRLRAELRSDVAFIEAIGDDLVRAGGKRLRPTLAFLAADLVGADPETAMEVALAVELLHAASLLHDDLIDDAETRRGAVAAFRRYGNVVSVMSGDFMLARVLGLLARSGSAEFTRLMSETAALICEGEVLQFQAATLETYDLDVYRRVIEGKTAALLATALEAPALLAGRPSRPARRPAPLRHGLRPGLPDAGRPPRPARRRVRARQAGGRRPARRQGDPVGAGAAGGRGRGAARGPAPPRPRARRRRRIVELVREHGADRRAAPPSWPRPRRDRRPRRVPAVGVRRCPDGPGAARDRPQPLSRRAHRRAG